MGAKLDSWGDVLTYGCMISGSIGSGLQMFAPAGLVFSRRDSVVYAAGVHALNKFGEYPSYHTLGAKTAAVLMAPAFYLLTLMGADLFFNAVIVSI